MTTYSPDIIAIARQLCAVEGNDPDKRVAFGWMGEFSFPWESYYTKAETLVGVRFKLLQQSLGV